MTNITTFNFNTNTIRVIEIDSQPWFVAADVCRVLELNIEKHGAAHYLGHLGADEINRHRVAGMRGPAPYTISESGLYKLIMRSDKREARQFQDWVTREVLPAIRKDGMYVLGEEKVATGEMSEDELILRAMEAMNRKIKRHQDVIDTDLARNLRYAQAADIRKMIKRNEAALATFGIIATMAETSGPRGELLSPRLGRSAI